MFFHFVIIVRQFMQHAQEIRLRASRVGFFSGTARTLVGRSRGIAVAVATNYLPTPTNGKRQVLMQQRLPEHRIRVL